MPEKIFVDTSAFFALKCKTDNNHRKAVSFYNLLITEKEYSLFTSNLILQETVTLIKARLGNSYAIELGISFRKSNFVEIIWINEKLENKGWEIFDKYTDKEFSFIDCSSFALMEEYSISKAFTFDRHFEQFGFNIFP